MVLSKNQTLCLTVSYLHSTPILLPLNFAPCGLHWGPNTEETDKPQGIRGLGKFQHSMNDMKIELIVSFAVGSHFLTHFITFLDLHDIGVKRISILFLLLKLLPVLSLHLLENAKHLKHL